MLHEIFKKYECDKHGHNYGSLYELLSTFKEPESILEIGVFEGASMASWRERFPGADLTGLEIDTTHIKNSESYDLIKGDFRTYNTNKTFDWIIDDGSHNGKDVLDAFGKFWPKVNSGGFYIIEDLHCGFWYGWMEDINHIIGEATHNKGIESDKTKTGFVIQQKSIIAIQKA